MDYKLYEVGGHVRDSIIGIPSKDIDYTVVIDNPMITVCSTPECHEIPKYSDPVKAFNDFCSQITIDGYSIFLETPDCLTVRAKFPDSKEVADFVLARKETYTNESRTPTTELGTLEDDLLRRDFTLNAIARDMDGNIIDLVGGMKDLKQGILRTPLDTYVSFNDDPLRVLRALRFMITRNFDFSDDIMRTLHYYPVSRLSLVSDERIREELYKCFAHDTAKTLRVLYQFQRQGFQLADWIFENTSLWLMPTNKK